MENKEEKSLESLEKIYLKDKYPRSADTDFNRLDIKAKDLQQASELMEKKKQEMQNTEDYESYDFIRNEDPNLAQNYESFSLINGAKLQNPDEALEVQHMQDEDLVSDRYATPLKKLKGKMMILKYISLTLSFFVVAYLGYHLMNLIKWKLLYIESDDNWKKINDYYKNNSDNMVFGNVYATMVIYLLGISINLYNILVHLQTISRGINFYENDYLINHKIQEKCKRSRLLVLAFAIIFFIGNVFQIARFNYSTEFETLANTTSSEENKNDENEDPSIIASWRVYFYILVIAAVFIKIGLCFLNAVIWHFLVKIKFEYSKMNFDLRNQVNL